jgi:hypothetical protein
MVLVGVAAQTEVDDGAPRWAGGPRRAPTAYTRHPARYAGDADQFIDAPHT